MSVFEIELLNGLRMRGAGESRWTQMRTGGLFIAYLVLHAGASVDRKKFVYDLYPEEDFEVSSNRVRVGLARYRKIFGDRLSADSAQVSLRLTDIGVDYFDALDDFRRIVDEIDVEAERDALIGRLATLSKELLPECTDLWVRPWQESWRKECLILIRRLVAIELDRGSWEGAARACEAGFIHEPGDVGIWRSYLIALDSMGELGRGESELVAAQDSMSAGGLAELQEVIRDLRREDIDISARWSDAQLLRLGRVLARSIEDQPMEAVKFFMSHAASGEFYRNPAEFLPFLHELIEREGVEPAARQDMRLRVMDASGLKYDWEEVIHQTDILMAEEIDRERLARVFFGRSFALFQMRDYDGALRMIGDSVKAYEEMGDQIKAMNSRAVEASYRWHKGEYELGLQMYAEVREALATQDTPVAKGNIAINWANSGTVYAVLGRWGEALDAIRRSLSAVEVVGNENMLAMLNTIGGLILYKNGERNKGVGMLVDGLKRSYRRDSSREMQIGLEWAAGALADGGKLGEGKAVLDWADVWRKRTGHVRSVAEKLYADRVVSECRGVGAKPINPDEDVRKVVSFTIGQLREIEAG